MRSSLTNRKNERICSGKNTFLALFCPFYCLFWGKRTSKEAILPHLAAGCDLGNLNGYAPEYVFRKKSAKCTFALCTFQCLHKCESRRELLLGAGGVSLVVHCPLACLQAGLAVSIAGAIPPFRMVAPLRRLPAGRRSRRFSKSGCNQG